MLSGLLWLNPDGSTVQVEGSLGSPISAALLGQDALLLYYNALWAVSAGGSTSRLVMNIEYDYRTAHIARGLTVAGDHAFFTLPSLGGTGPNGGIEIQLWTTRGAAADTTRIATFSSIGAMVSLPSGLFFEGTEIEGGKELWYSNGTAEGTFRVRDIMPGASDGLCASPQWIEGVGVLFGGFDPEEGCEALGFSRNARVHGARGSASARDVLRLAQKSRAPWGRALPAGQRSRRSYALPPSADPGTGVSEGGLG